MQQLDSAALGEKIDYLRISLSEGGISDKHRLMSTYVRLWVSRAALYIEQLSERKSEKIFGARVDYIWGKQKEP